MVHPLEKLGGWEERLISVAFNSARVLLLSKMGCEIVSAKLLYGGVFLVGCFLKRNLEICLLTSLTSFLLNPVN